MINLTSSGGTITFAFDNNSGYLQNGTIEVPVNSLSLVIDGSDMVTFKKANSNDVFISALLSEFGMTKEEMIDWYKANMVGSTGGGGGGGITSGEVQTMIDESISGKQDTLIAGTGIDITNDVISVTGGTGGGITSGEVQTMIDESISGKVNTVDNQVDAYGVVSSSAETSESFYKFSADSYANAAFYFASDDVYGDERNKISGKIVIIDENNNVVEDYTVPTNQQTTSWNPNSQYFTVLSKTEDYVEIATTGDYRIKYCDINVYSLEANNTAKYYTTSYKYPSYQSAEAIENNVYPKLVELEARIAALEQQNNT